MQTFLPKIRRTSHHKVALQRFVRSGHGNMPFPSHVPQLNRLVWPRSRDRFRGNQLHVVLLGLARPGPVHKIGRVCISIRYICLRNDQRDLRAKPRLVDCHGLQLVARTYPLVQPPRIHHHLPRLLLTPSRFAVNSVQARGSHIKIVCSTDKGVRINSEPGRQRHGHPGTAVLWVDLATVSPCKLVRGRGKRQ